MKEKCEVHGALPMEAKLILKWLFKLLLRLDSKVIFIFGAIRVMQEIGRSKLNSIVKTENTPLIRSIESRWCVTVMDKHSIAQHFAGEPE